MERRIVLGSPTFSLTGRNDHFVAPVGLEELYVRYWNQMPKDHAQLSQTLRREYYALVNALEAARIRATKLISHTLAEVLDPGLAAAAAERGLPYAWIETADPALYGFPRDIGLYVSPSLGFVSTRFEGKLPAGLTQSIYGEAGRVHIRRDVVLMNEWYYRHEKDGSTTRMLQPNTMLQKAGFRIGYTPAILQHREDPGEVIRVSDSHLDRWNGLLEDRTGGLHLILPGEVHTCDGPPDNDFYTPAETQARIGTMCAQLGIELHVLHNLEIPGSVGFYQSPEGKVIMTGGEPQLETLVQGLVGDSNVFPTHTPITTYPLACGATIHCLIGELPSPLLYH